MLGLSINKLQNEKKDLQAYMENLLEHNISKSDPTTRGPLSLNPFLA